MFFCLSFLFLFFCNANVWSESPSSFEIGRAVGNNISGAFEENRDRNAIKNILNEVSQSEDPEDIHNAICKVFTQVSPERQSAIIAYLQDRYEQLKEKQDRARHK